MVIRGTQAASVSAEGDRLRGGGGRRWKDRREKDRVKGKHNETHLPSVKRTKGKDSGHS